MAESAQDPTKERTSVVESGVADPAPLGLAAFALTTFAFSVVNAGLLGEPAINHFVPLALIYGGLVQLIAGLWEFRNENTFASTGFCSYGAFWIALGILEIFARQLGIAEEQVPIALAWTFTAWAIFTLYMWLASWGINVALGIVFTLLLATFILLADRHRVYRIDGDPPDGRLGRYRHGYSRLVRLGGGRAKRHLRTDDPARRACCRRRPLEKRYTCSLRRR